MEPFYGFDLYIYLIFFLIFTGEEKIIAAACRTCLPVTHWMVHFLVCLFRFRLFQDMAFVPPLPAFRLPRISSAVRDMPVFPWRRLAGWGRRVRAVPSKQGLRMGEPCRKPMDYGILFFQLPLMILDDGGNPIIVCFQHLPVLVHQFLDLVVFPIQFGLVFFPV